MASSLFLGFGVTTDGSGNATISGTLTVSGATTDAVRYSAGGTAGVVAFGPSAVASLTVKGGIVTAVS